MGLRRRPRGPAKLCASAAPLPASQGRNPTLESGLAAGGKPEPSPLAGAGLWQCWQPGLRSEEVLSKGHPPGSRTGGGKGHEEQSVTVLKLSLK